MSDKIEPENYRLNFELVPDSCWCSNLRTLFPAEWDKIRRDAYARAGGRCMICGREARRLEAHERWAYDEENAVQRLTDVVALCYRCHEAVDIGRAQATGRGREAEDWFMKVNGVNYAALRAALGRANEDHRRRNQIAEWKLDLSWLKRYL